MRDGTLPDIAELEAEVRRRLGGQAHNIRLVSRENGLILRGYARTYYGKQLAQQAVMKATRLPILANETEVPSNFSGISDGVARLTTG